MNYIRVALYFVVFRLAFQPVFASELDTIPQFDSLRNNQVKVFARYFFMATDNSPGLIDYHAHGVCFQLAYHSPEIKGFHINLSGSSSFNLESSSLERLDPITLQPNRYEIGLFNISDPSSHKALNRFEDANVYYRNKKSYICVGNQSIRTPFINPQDGRLRPTLIQGITGEWNKWEKWKFQYGWIMGISPRSSQKWYSVGNSIGIYSVGIDGNGIKSGYAGNLNSRWIAYLGLEKSIGKNITLQLFNQYVERIFNTQLIQLNWKKPIFPKKDIHVFASAQFIGQQAIGNGGNVNPLHTYIDKGAQSNVWGLRLGIEKMDNWKASINATRISSVGRYLMPREWGREPFFTFMPREKNDGFGDVKAMNIMTSKMLGKSGLKLESGYGIFLLPDVINTRLNKYGIPSYQQFNFDLLYAFKGRFSGLTCQFLYVFKGKIGEVYGDKRYVINKVDMSLFNCIVNYSF